MSWPPKKTPPTKAALPEELPVQFMEMLSPKLSADEKLAAAISEFYADPLGYVMFAFPWDTDPSIQMVELEEPYRSRFNCHFGPDKWACEFLDQLGKEIAERGFDGRTAVDPIQFTTSSGHGIGKSTLVAWLIKFIMDTRPYAKGVVTANTADQLRTKTWAELGKWHKLSVTQHWFDYTSGRGSMSLVHKKHRETWRCDAQTCREENSESFAGLHAANSTPFYIFDEASNVPDKIFEVREGGTTDGEPMVFDFGNPTRNSGKFFENTQGRFRKRYIVRKIDSRDVSITNKKRIAQWIEDYGEDSDFCKVRVRGDFPAMGSLQFISREDVLEAMYRDLEPQLKGDLIIGVDVARFGDDESVIYPRIGNDARSWFGSHRRFRGLDTVQLTGKVIEVIREFRALGKPVAGLFVDGTGIGGGVVDQLNALGYNPIEVQFGSKPIDTSTYRYKSDEMWGRMRDGIKRNLILPGHRDSGGMDIQTQLTQREFGYTVNGQRIHLEPKSDMKERLGSEASSPDIADALALTYAMDVAPMDTLNGTEFGNQPQGSDWDYNPFEEN